MWRRIGGGSVRPLQMTSCSGSNRYDCRKPNLPSFLQRKTGQSMRIGLFHTVALVGSDAHVRALNVDQINPVNFQKKRKKEREKKQNNYSPSLTAYLYCCFGFSRIFIDWVNLRCILGPTTIPLHLTARHICITNHFSHVSFSQSSREVCKYGHTVLGVPNARMHEECGRLQLCWWSTSILS